MCLFTCLSCLQNWAVPGQQPCLIYVPCSLPSTQKARDHVVGWVATCPSRDVQKERKSFHQFLHFYLKFPKRGELIPCLTWSSNGMLDPERLRNISISQVLCRKHEPVYINNVHFWIEKHAQNEEEVAHNVQFLFWLLGTKIWDRFSFLFLRRTRERLFPLSINKRSLCVHRFHMMY